MLMSADIHKDTHTEVMSVRSLSNTPIYMLCKERREKRWSRNEREGGDGRDEECTDEISAALNLCFSYFTVTSY